MQFRPVIGILCGVIVAGIIVGRGFAIGTVIYGAPAYDPATRTGYEGAEEVGNQAVAGGTSIGTAEKYDLRLDKGSRPLRWDASGEATELGNLGTNSSGFTNVYANAVNIAGTAAGVADKYVMGSGKGTRAVRWDATSAVATELGNLGTDNGGTT